MDIFHLIEERYNFDTEFHIKLDMVIDLYQRTTQFMMTDEAKDQAKIFAGLALLINERRG